MAASNDTGTWRLIAAAAGVSGALAILSTLLAIGYLQQRKLRESALDESIRATAAGNAARAAANGGLRARDQAEELVGFLLDDLRDELFQLNRSDLLEATAEKAVQYFDQLPPDLVTAESQARQASILLTLSDARYQQGDHKGAIAAANRSIELWKHLVDGGDPQGKYTVRLGRAMGELGLYQNQSNDPYAAANTYREMIRLYENPDAHLPDDGWRDHGLAKAHLGLGEIERHKRNFRDARAEYAQAVAHITTALTHHSNEISWLQMSMTLHNNAGVTLMQDKDYTAARQEFQQSEIANRTLIRLEPRNRRWEKELATTLLNLGSLFHLQHDDAQAERCLREAVALRQGVADWDPNSTRAMRKLAHAWHRQAVFQFDTGQSTNAGASGRQALKTLRRLINADPADREAIAETLEYTEKYRDRLNVAGMTNEARQLVRETITFAEANSTSTKATVADWAKLQAALAEKPSESTPAP